MEPPTAHSFTLCSACRVLRIKFLAALGWDIHSHARDAPCMATCVTRTVGRRNQHWWMLEAASDRKWGFRIVKEIDGLPRVNAGPQLSAVRTMRFLSQKPQCCYQRIDTVEQLLTQLRLIDRVETAAGPTRTLPYVTLVLEVFEWDHRSKTGQLRIPGSGVRSLGLHTVVPEGRRVHDEHDLPVVEFWNSWGGTWGHNGYGSVDREYLDRYFREAWIIWDARWGWHPSSPDSFWQNDPQHLRRLWTIENRTHVAPLSGGYSGDAWRLERFSTVALSGEILEVIQVRNGYGLRMGWAHLFHADYPEISEIRELFVMPAFRRQSVGAVLEGMCTESALRVGSVEIHLLMHEADSVIGVSNPPRAKARRFATSRGYEWRWPQGRPGVVGVAVKPVNEAAVKGLRAT